MNWPPPGGDPLAAGRRVWPAGLVVSLAAHAVLLLALVTLRNEPVENGGFQLRPPPSAPPQVVVLPPLASEPVSPATPVPRAAARSGRTRGSSAGAVRSPAARPPDSTTGGSTAVEAPAATGAESAEPARIAPSLGDARLWARPLPLPPRELAQRLRGSSKAIADSLVTATVQAYLDSMAREPGAATKLPDWTTKIGGKKYGIDGRNVYIAGLKIPAAVLALLPIPATGNFDQAKANQRLEDMRADLLRAAQRAENFDEFKRAIKRIRERREAEEEFERAQRTPPPPDTTQHLPAP